MTVKIRNVMYNPSVWILAGIGLLIMGYATRCGDAYR